MPSSGGTRYTKYSVKFDAATVSSRFTQVKDLALRKAQDAQGILATIETVVAPILDDNGIVGPDRAKYLGFAKKIWRAAQRHGDVALEKLVDGIKAYYTSMGCDSKILDQIVSAITGSAPTATPTT